MSTYKVFSIFAVKLALFATSIFLFHLGNEAIAQEDGSKTQNVSSTGEVFNSARWRKLKKSFDEWLSVQKVYKPSEVADIQARLQSQVASMSEPELDDFMRDMEDRLEILMSDEAFDARNYLSFYNEKARRQLIAPDGKPPQFFDMTISQLRQELSQFQQQRQQRAASHNTFRQLQGERTRAISQEQRQRQVRQQQSTNQARSQIANSRQQQPVQQRHQPNLRSQYAPRPLVTSDEFARFQIMRGIF